MSFAESQRPTMIKHRPHRASATPAPDTPESAGAAPAPSTVAPSTAKPKTTKGAVKGTELGEQIGHKLKAMFDDVLAEPVPEKFRELLEELGRKSDQS
jgi:anti-sigma factor NepR-like protein